MDTTPVRYAGRPLTLAVLGIIALEMAARAVDSDPLLLTAGIRVLGGILIVGVSLRYSAQSRIPGLFPSDFKNGIWRGVLWSGGFAVLAAAGAVAIFIAGVDPLHLIRVRLPSDPERIALFFLVGGVIGPVAEELFFRGVIYGFLRRWGMGVAIMGSTALFVSAHGISGIALPQLVGGVVFAVAYEYEKNLLVPIIIHVTGNLAMFSLGFL